MRRGLTFALAAVGPAAPAYDIAAVTAESNERVSFLIAERVQEALRS